MLAAVWVLAYHVMHMVVAVWLAVAGMADTVRLVLGRYVAEPPDDAENIKRAAQQLSKLPSHVGIILDAEDARALPQVARLVCWAVAAGVRYISIYDADGVVKSELHNLKLEVEKRKRAVFGSAEWPGGPSIGFSMPHPAAEFELDPAAVGALSQVALAKAQHHVLVLSMDDTRRDIAAMARKFCRAVEVGRCQPDVLTPELIQANLSSRIPDPELVLRFGAVLTLQGYLPWHIRLTEFGHIRQPIRLLRLSTFMAHLRIYSNCVQRYGT